MSRFVDHDSGRDRLSAVTDIRRVTPSVVRVTVAGDLDDYVDNGTDQHVAVLFYGDDMVIPDPYTPEAIEAMQPYARPVMRRYTIGRFLPDRNGGRGAVEFDVVAHGRAGRATAARRLARSADPVSIPSPDMNGVPTP